VAQDKIKLQNHVKPIRSMFFSTTRNNGNSAGGGDAYFNAVAVSLAFFFSRGACLGQLTETRLLFYPSANQSFQREFGFIPGTLSNGPISFVRHDLLDSSGHAVIPASEILIEPPTASAPLANQNFLFRITLKGPPRAGSYSGKVEVSYPSLTTGSPQTAQLEIACQSSLPPSVEPDSTVPLVLSAAKMNGFEALLRGREPARTSARFQLQQTIDSPAEILAVYPSTFRSAKGISFSGNSLAVAPAGTPHFAGREAKDFDFSITGPLPPAGEYNGSIVANVRNQSALIKVPAKVQIKNGWLLAFLVLVAGLVVAMLVPWWNATGKEMSELLDKTLQQIGYLPRQPRLQVADRKLISMHLEDVLQAIDAHRTIEQVRVLYQQTQDEITTMTADTASIMASLTGVRTQLAAVVDAAAFQKRLRTVLDTLATGLDRGTIGSREEARVAVDEITREIAAAQALLPRWNALDQATREALKDRWSQAATVEELSQLLARPDTMVLGAAMPPAPLAAAQPTKIHNPRYDARRMLLFGKLAVSAFLWIIILWGGMVMVYGSSATFGSDPKDYISLFFWGASFEVIRGQAISLAGLKGALKL
jgi:hypothetical protein